MWISIFERMKKRYDGGKVAVSMSRKEYEQVKAEAEARSLKMASLIRMVFFQALKEGK